MHSLFTLHKIAKEEEKAKKEWRNKIFTYDCFPKKLDGGRNHS